MDNNNRNEDRTVVVDRDNSNREPAPNSSGPLIAIIAVVVLVVLGILAYNMLTGDTNDTTGTGTNNDSTLNDVTPAPAPTQDDTTAPTPAPVEDGTTAPTPDDDTTTTPAE